MLGLLHQAGQTTQMHPKLEQNRYQEQNILSVYKKMSDIVNYEH